MSARGLCGLLLLFVVLVVGLICMRGFGSRNNY